MIMGVRLKKKRKKRYTPSLLSALWRLLRGPSILDMFTSEQVRRSIESGGDFDEYY
jgi:hypothetical protein